MKIVLLGKSCTLIEDCIMNLGHEFQRIEEICTIDFLQAENFEFGISYGYKHILKKEIVEFFSGKLIRLHLSYLPYNRGYDPNLWSIVENTTKGVSIHLIDEGFDTGDILLQQKVDFDFENDTLKTSYSKLSKALEQLFAENASALIDSKIVATKQAGVGTFHKSTDKNKLMSMLSPLFWETPIKDLVNGLSNLASLEVKINPYIAADYSHIKDVYLLANSKEVRANSIHKDFFSYSDHCSWYDERLKKGNFFIISCNNKFGGYVRFDLEGNDDVDILSVTVAVKEESYGLGLASSALREICPRFLTQNYNSKLVAYILSDNLVSQKLFTSVGFSFIKEVDDLQYYEYKPYNEIE